MVGHSFTFVLFALFFIMPFGAWGQTHQPVSCFPEVTSLQSYEVWDPDDSTLVKTYPLKTQKSGQLHVTDVLVDVHYDSEKQNVHLSFHFADSEIMSLPFNVYAVMLTTESGQSLWKDFTKSCNDPGIGFYPGQNIRLEPLPLKLKPNESYRVMIWGQK